MLKIEDVKVGDELECIDLKSMAKKWENASDLWRKAKIDALKVSSINKELVVVYFQDNKFYLEEHEFQYFKKKEQSQQYTFDDLIDVSSKAVKDGLFASIKTDFKSVIQLKRIGECDDDSTVFHNGKHNAENYKYIQSLYKETFVIECEEDLKRVKLNPKITLNNGEVIPFSFKSAVKDHLIFYDQSCGHNMIHFVFLKGATVEQKRGCDDRS